MVPDTCVPTCTVVTAWSVPGGADGVDDVAARHGRRRHDGRRHRVSGSGSRRPPPTPTTARTTTVTISFFIQTYAVAGATALPGPGAVPAARRSVRAAPRLRPPQPSSNSV